MACFYTWLVCTLCNCCTFIFVIVILFFSVYSLKCDYLNLPCFLFIYLAPSLALKFSSFMKHLVFQPALNLNIRLKRTLHILSLGSLLNCSLDFQNLQFILSTIIMMLMGPFHYGLLHFSLLTRLKMAFFYFLFNFCCGVRGWVIGRF